MTGAWLRGLLFVALLSCAFTSMALAQDGETTLPEDDQCILCHAELDDELAAPIHDFATDVHLAAGLSCADCHGGDRTSDDADESMSPAKGFNGVPGPLQVPQMCNACHGDAAYMKGFNPALPVDQYIKYRTSVHGERNGKGDLKVAHCASCHPAHRIMPTNDPTSSVYPSNIPAMCGGCHADPVHMEGYGLPTDQLAGYSESAHGQALLERHDVGAPACNDCHGNHAATPPLTSSIANVCGNCHAFNAELFAASPHRAAYQEAEIPACEICHGAHRIRSLNTENLGGGDESVCLDCHATDDGTRGLEVAQVMKVALDSLERAYEHAESLLAVAERKGMFVEEAVYTLRDARQTLIQAHTQVHSFSAEAVSTRVDSGLAVVTAVAATGVEQIEESSFRRWGLVISTLIISLLVVLLYLKIRAIERQ